jgi:L-iditol 2-dehydrogenase
MSLDQATLITTAAASLYGIRWIGGIRVGETVVVLGPGAICLMAVVMARLSGAGTIILTGTRAQRLEVGRRLGADVVTNIREEGLVERVRESTQAAVDAVELSKKKRSRCPRGPL